MTINLESLISQGLDNFSSIFKNPFITAIIIVGIVILISTNIKSQTKTIVWSSVITLGILLMHDHANNKKIHGGSFTNLITGNRIGAAEFIKLDNPDKTGDSDTDSPLIKPIKKGGLAIPELKGINSIIN